MVSSRIQFHRFRCSSFVAEAGHDLEAKKGARSMGIPRSRPPSMSLSQTFSTAGRHAVTHTVGAVGRPLSSGKIKGIVEWTSI